MVPFVQTAPSRCCREIRPRLKPARRGHIPRQDLGPSLLMAGEGLAAWREMKRLPIREKAGELVLRHARPGPYVAGVHMNELGRGVITDAAIRMRRDRAQAAGLDVRQPNVHGFTQHVLAVLGNTARATSQHAVGGWRAVGRDDVDGELHLGRIR